MAITDSCRNEIQAVQHAFLESHHKLSQKKKKKSSLLKSLKFWFHKSGTVNPRCIICTLVGEACILRFDMPYFISILKTQRLGKKGKVIWSPNMQRSKWQFPDHFQVEVCESTTPRFKLLYINFKHHMRSANHQPACLVVVISLLTVTYRYLVSPA